MTVKADDIVCVASGSLIQVEEWHETLQAAGIESRIVGDELTGGLGSALPGSIELWVRRADATAAEDTVAGAGGRTHREPGSHPVPRPGPPVPVPEYDPSRTPQHGAPPHRPLPSE